MDTRGLNETGSDRLARLFAFATAFALTVAVVLMVIATGTAKASTTVDLGQYAPTGNDLGLTASSTFKAKKPKKPKKKTFSMSIKVAEEVTAATMEYLGTNSTPSELVPSDPDLQGSQWAQYGTGNCKRKNKSRVTCDGAVISNEIQPGIKFVCLFPVDVWYPRAVKKPAPKYKIGQGQCGYINEN